MNILCSWSIRCVNHLIRGCTQISVFQWLLLGTYLQISLILGARPQELRIEFPIQNRCEKVKCLENPPNNGHDMGKAPGFPVNFPGFFSATFDDQGAESVKNTKENHWQHQQRPYDHWKPIDPFRLVSSSKISISSASSVALLRKKPWNKLWSQILKCAENHLAMNMMNIVFLFFECVLFINNHLWLGNHRESIGNYLFTASQLTSCIRQRLLRNRSPLKLARTIFFHILPCFP